ncbi:MAG: right-handed parallel beta-helix repeat-containing protein [Proteobacteria bacterium]|nr:right-handed parallel beta-helix repeat-containing protein [Pseudomonadota bacterium]MBU1710085.1 right-handed parallel beta-helix repeat-containing protein [Pseudomonadota bacterium]
MKLIKIPLLLLLIIIFLLFSAQAFAQEFFVSPQGNDKAGAGTIIHPWKTISKGVKKLRPGDILNIREGVYRESVRLKITGSHEQPITIRNYKDEKVVLTGTVAINGGWQKYDNNGKTLWQRNIWDDAKNFSKKKSNKNRFQPRILIQNSNGQEMGDFLKADPIGATPIPPHQEISLSEVNEPGEWFFDSQHGTLSVFPRDIDNKGFDANNYTFEVGVLATAIIESGSKVFRGIIIDGLHFYGYTGVSFVELDKVEAGGGIFFAQWDTKNQYFRSQIQIKNCTFEKCYRPVVLVQIDYVTISNCRFIECFDQGIAAYRGNKQDLIEGKNDDIHITDTTFKWMYNHYPPIQGGGGSRSAAIKIMATRGAKVENCIVDYAENINGIWFDVGSSHGIIANNTISRVGKAGIFVENKSNYVKVENNTVKESGAGIKIGTVNSRQGKDNAPIETMMTSNTIENCKVGVLLEAAVKPAIEKNSIHDSQLSQVYVSDETEQWNDNQGITIKENSITTKGGQYFYKWGGKYTNPADLTGAELKGKSKIKVD